MPEDRERETARKWFEEWLRKNCKDGVVLDQYVDAMADLASEVREECANTERERIEKIIEDIQGTAGDEMYQARHVCRTILAAIRQRGR